MTPDTTAAAQRALARLLAETPGTPAGVDATVLAAFPDDYCAWGTKLLAVEPDPARRRRIFTAALKGRPDAKAIAAAVLAADPAAADPAPADPITATLRLTSWADKEPQAARWAPGGISAVGGLNVFAGDGGVGKTRLIMSGAAARTRGQRWPHTAAPCPDGIEVADLPPGVLFCGAEDAVETTLLPAFLHAGGDKSKVSSIDGVFVPLRDGADTKEVGFDLSERAIQGLDAALATGNYGEVIIDGLTGYVEGDGKGDTETRRSLLPLVLVLRRRGVIGTTLMHFGKGTKRASDKLIQSVAFRNVARTVYYVVPDPAEVVGGTPERSDYRRLVFNEKINGGRAREPFAYRVADDAVPDSAVRTGGVFWDPQPVDCSLNDALRAADATPDQASAAQGIPQAVIKAALAMRGGWAPSRDVFAAGEVVGVPERTLQYARSKLELPTRRIGAGPGSVVWWGLPSVPFPDPSEGQR